MPDVVGVDIKSNSSSSTFAEITAMTCTARTDAVGTHVDLTVQVRMGSSSALYTHSSDMSLGRVFTGTLNGHDIGWHVIKRYNLDRWEYSTTYNYNISFDIPYSPGTIYCNFAIVPQGSGSYPTASTFTWTANTYTRSSPSATACTAPASGTIGGSAGLIVANMSGSLTLAWSAGTSHRTYREYAIFYLMEGGSWTYLTTTTSLSTSINMATFAALPRGQTVYFLVRCQDGYTYADNIVAYAQLANVPSAPTAASVPATSKYNASLAVTFSGAVANYGTLGNYKIEVRRKAAGSGTWSSWVVLTTTQAASPCNTTPSTYAAWTVRPGDTLQYRIYSTNSYGLTSSTAKETGEVVMKGGIMRIKVSGTWREGTAWIKVAGVWKEASSVYERVSGVWKESI